MWIRSVIGVVLIGMGGIWIAQGLGALDGSMMSGQGQYAALGAVLALGGVALIAWDSRSRRRSPRQ